MNDLTMNDLSFGNEHDVIFTSYFSSKSNPQPGPRGEILHAPRNDINYIYPWYSTVCHLQLNGVVIHDGLSDSFIKQYSTPRIQFRYHKLGKMSLNDERFLALNEILQEQSFRKVLMTDASDLIFKRNPFDFFTEHNLIYVGTDDPSRPRIRDNPWCINKAQTIMRAGNGLLEFDNSFFDFNYVNAGVIGGGYQIVKHFMESLAVVLEFLSTNDNYNMMAINYLLWKYRIPHFKGKPLTSHFKKYELDGDYFIVHK
jgi:hypothetical protein